MFWRTVFDGVYYGDAHHPALATRSFGLFGRSDSPKPLGWYQSDPIPDWLLFLAEAIAPRKG
jgi:hypothetical protein